MCMYINIYTHKIEYVRHSQIHVETHMKRHEVFKKNANLVLGNVYTILLDFGKRHVYEDRIQLQFL